MQFVSGIISSTMLINIYRQHNAQIICLRVQYWLERLYSKESQLEGEHQSVFGPIAECICPNCKMYLLHLQNVFVQISQIFLKITKSYVSECSYWLERLYRKESQLEKENTKVYLSQLQNVFVPIAKCCCPKIFLKITKSYVSECSTGLSDYTVRRVSWKRGTPEAVLCPKIPPFL